MRSQILVLMLLSTSTAAAFTAPLSVRSNARSCSTTTSTCLLLAEEKPHISGGGHGDRRDFMTTAAKTAALWGMFLLPLSSSPQPAQAKVFLDPAMYGDQELRVSAVDTLRERVRRAILQNPALAPAFYQLSLLDGLTYDAKSGQYGPNGGILYPVLSLKSPSSPYLQRLQEAAQVVVESSKALKRVSSITVADSLALSGAQAIESIGGPVLPVQLGRMDLTANAAASTAPINLELLSGKVPPSQVEAAFRRAGLTEREMTALLGALMTIELVEKERTTADWKESAKPKFRERGKMGRMDEYKRLSDEDLANAERTEFDDDDDENSVLGDHDDGWYIADSFGSREERFGDRIGKGDIDEKTFNKFLHSLMTDSQKKDSSTSATATEYGWVATLLLDPDSPVTQAWLSKYGTSNLSFLKDLKIAFNSVTQLGAEYTGGKYESLLKDKPRKTLSDF